MVEGAPALLGEAGVADRCAAVGGHMAEPFPAGRDLDVLSRVLHDWEDARAVVVLRTCRPALHGRLCPIVVERVLPDRVEPDQAVQAVMLSDLDMLVRTGGRERTRGDFAALLAQADLRLVRVVATRGAVAVVQAVPA